MGDKSDGTSAAFPRKPMKFTPKIPRKMSKPAVAKMEPPDDANNINIIDSQLLKSLKSREGSGRRDSKVPTEQLQVTFGYEDRSVARSFGIPRGNVDRSKHQDGDDVLAPLPKKKDAEPWDRDSYYPVTLPLRRPDSRSQEVLDEEEFGEMPENLAKGKTSTPAEDLGLMNRNEKARMLFFQLPTRLPAKNQFANPEIKKEADAKRSKGCIFQEFSAGYVGKMLVYKSGAVKLKMGDILFDVSPGVDSIFAQDVAAINTKEKHCCILGNIEKRAVVTPNVDSLLDAIIDQNRFDH